MGDPTDQNVCQGYTIEHATVTMTANTIDHCKFGIRLVDDAVVDASGNTITNNSGTYVCYPSSGVTYNGGYYCTTGNTLTGSHCYPASDSI